MALQKERGCDSWMDMDQQKHTQIGMDSLGCKQRVLKGVLDRRVLLPAPAAARPSLVALQRERVCDSWMDIDEQKHIQTGMDSLGCTQRVLIKGCLIGGFFLQAPAAARPTLVTRQRERVCDSWMDVDQQKHTQIGTDLLGREQRVPLKGCVIGGF